MRSTCSRTPALRTLPRNQYAFLASCARPPPPGRCYSSIFGINCSSTVTSCGTLLPSRVDDVHIQIHLYLTTAAIINHKSPHVLEGVYGFHITLEASISSYLHQILPSPYVDTSEDTSEVLTNWQGIYGQSFLFILIIV